MSKAFTKKVYFLLNTIYIHIYIYTYIGTCFNWYTINNCQPSKEGTNIKIVFSTFKLASLFSTKDKVPYGLKSYVIYKFLCAGCNASYVGEIYRHISARPHGHLEIDKGFNIYGHLLKNQQCQSICDENCFSILDSARTKYTPKLKEGMYVKWLKPSLKQTDKMCFALDSCIEKTIQYFSMSSNIMPFRYLHVL